MASRSKDSTGDTGTKRDIAVVAASAGGVEALTSLARGLPADLPVALLVVLHFPPTATSRLPEILSRAGPLEAETARHGQIARAGMIHVAPPDRHMVLSGNRIFLLDGPRENGVRPAADPLFRSAASSMGERVIGVVRPIESRVGAPVAATCYVDHSPPVVRETGPDFVLIRGEGRPSKRLRRELERLRRAGGG